MSKKLNMELRFRCFLAFGKKTTLSLSLSFPYWLAGDDDGSQICTFNQYYPSGTPDLLGQIFEDLRLAVHEMRDRWSSLKADQGFVGRTYCLPAGFHSLLNSFVEIENFYEQLDHTQMYDSVGREYVVSQIVNAEVAGLSSVLPILVSLTNRASKQQYN